MPPSWVDDSEEMSANFQRIRTKMGELVNANAKALMPTFEDEKEDLRMIEVNIREITELLRNSETRLKKILKASLLRTARMLEKKLHNGVCNGASELVDGSP